MAEDCRLNKGDILNNKQRKIIFIAIGILILMLIFPPWQYKVETSSLTKNAIGPYRLIFIGPPDVPTTSREGSRAYFKEHYRPNWTAEVDWSRLILSCVVIVLIASGFVLYFKK